MAESDSKTTSARTQPKAKQSIAERKAKQKAWRNSERGRAAQAKYRKTEKGIAYLKRKRERQHKYNQRPEVRAHYRNYTLKKNYGITQEEYDKLAFLQGNCCGICGGKFIEYHNGRKAMITRFSIDHCHKTGVIRGLLCRKCNRAIGLLNES
jgi:hypothetical protein